MGYQGTGFGLENCHSHNAEILNNLKYKGYENYGTLSIWKMTITQGQYISWKYIFKTYFFYLLGIIAAIIYYAITEIFLA